MNTSNKETVSTEHLSPSRFVQPYHWRVDGGPESQSPELINRIYHNAEYIGALRSWLDVLKTGVPKIRTIEATIAEKKTQVYVFAGHNYPADELKGNIEKIGSKNHDCDENPMLYEQVQVSGNGPDASSDDKPKESVWLDLRQGFGFSLTEKDAELALQIAQDQLSRIGETQWRSKFEEQLHIGPNASGLPRNMLNAIYQARTKFIRTPDLKARPPGQIIHNQ